MSRTGLEGSGKAAVVLLSGGLDSATCAGMALERGYRVAALTIDYGQRHRAELDAAQAVARALEISDHRVVTVDLRAIGGSALTADIGVPKTGLTEEIPVTYVPARNTVFLALALGLAEVVGAEAVFLGVNAVDYSGYPDCRPEFVAAFQALARLATKSGVEGRPLEVAAPLLHLSKVEIVREARRLGVPVELTVSCYDPGPGGAPCGSCDACRIRDRALTDA
ncbi:MAG: 7-cyano-7-deazaguanine synthase QueC [Fimbriimonadaceae bacterium]|nr:7-cyano-7-deazaguanine synthase QueC [Fimbriimonadaceae bacterium]QYK55783.1 MAG: 7-cyano-7-deazaguanine synthase QueC [Fimbriimonadaceae bacterium]